MIIEPTTALNPRPNRHPQGLLGAPGSGTFTAHAMIALDTNILVRCPTLDEPGQVPAAKALPSYANGVFVAKTVLLELEWVLRAAYKLPRPVIQSALVKLLGLANLSVESPGQVSQALLGYSQGLDFADALHLFASATDEGFFTFDAHCAGTATAAGLAVQLAAAHPFPGARGYEVEKLEDLELTAMADARAGQPVIRVKLDEL